MARTARRGRRWIKLAVAAAGLVLIGWIAFDLATLPDPAVLARENPKTTALIRQREEAARAKGKKARRRQHWVALSAIAPHAIDAVIISEDASFWAHEGVDYGELRNAAEEAWEQGALGRGASTITQQLAKNLWLSSERSLWRKLEELILARRLEQALPKKRILSLYLNVVEWGDGVYGVEAGAREHFGISASELSVAQGAILAAMLPSPRRWTPKARPPVLRTRALRIVERLEKVGKISAMQAALARAEVDQLLGVAPAAEVEAEALEPEE